jgi:hypothetical protein
MSVAVYAAFTRRARLAGVTIAFQQAFERMRREPGGQHRSTESVAVAALKEAVASRPRAVVPNPQGDGC